MTENINLKLNIGSVIRVNKETKELPIGTYIIYLVSITLAISDTNSKDTSIEYFLEDISNGYRDYVLKESDITSDIEILDTKSDLYKVTYLDKTTNTLETDNVFVLHDMALNIDYFNKRIELKYDYDEETYSVKPHDIEAKSWVLLKNI